MEIFEFIKQVMEIAQSPATSRLSVPELMQQLQVTQNELENIKVIVYIALLVGYLVRMGWDFFADCNYFQL